MTVPAVSIFIPTWNDERDLAACLDSLAQLNYPHERVEIVVWDNASRDATQAVVRERFAAMERLGWMGLHLITSERNEGSYVPYNRAAEALAPQTRYILGLDADVELAPDLLRQLVAAAGDRVAVVGARSVYFDRPQRTAHGAGRVGRWTARYGERDARSAIDCDYVIGCCWLLDRTVFQAVGGFDPDFFLNHWEVEYCLRVKTRGFRVRYEPRAVVRHKIVPGGTRNPERVYYLYRNKLLLIDRTRWFPRRRFTRAACTVMAGARIAARALAGAAAPETRAAVRGLRDGLRGRVGERGIVP
jgi:GT2 family glycosyltransferase